MLGVLKRRPLVSICVPAYRSDEFIAETLTSALEQTLQDLEIVISNDGGHATPALDSFARNRRIRIRHQSRRLGWVENSNMALGMGRGLYRMILPHDDTLKPTYVEKCLDLLESAPEAFSAHSDIEFNPPARPIQAWEVRGGLEERISYVMHHLHKGFSFRALMRWNPKRSEELRLSPNPPSDFAVDTIWILQQACFGELRRVPEVLYCKRMHARNTHTAWAGLSPEMLRRSWEAQCDIMGEIVRRHLGHAEASRLVAYRKTAVQVREAPPFVKTAVR